MKFVNLLEKVSVFPVFTVRFLAAGGNLAQIRLHKGLYTLAEADTHLLHLRFEELGFSAILAQY